MDGITTIPDILIKCAADFPDKAAFVSRNGEEFSFSRLHMHARFLASELTALGLSGRAAAIMGGVNYSGVAAMFGCLFAGIPVIPADSSLSEDELAELLTSYDVGVLFFSAKHSDRARALARRLPSLFVIPETEELLSTVEEAPAVETEILPEDPAFMFFTSRDRRAAILSHKNICSNLFGVACAVDMGSYTFLSPSGWGRAFDCVIGLLLPLYCGCTVIQRGEKRGVAKAIAESGATALTCTPERLLSLEKSLKVKSVKVLGKAKIVIPDLIGTLLRALGLSVSKHMYRRIRSLLGNSLKLVICGGSYPDRDCVRQFVNWGFDVYNCYFLAECGAVAISASGGKPVPLMEVNIAATDPDSLGEIMLSGENLASGYFGGKTIDSPFSSGDIGRLSEDGSLEIFGKRRTMLMSAAAPPVFPEEIAAALLRSRYISRCSVSGRFDTGSSSIIVSALITPDLKAVSSVLGNNFSDNRLRLFMGRELEKLAPKLPHRINEFRIAEKKA